jgi:hypothetical protein
MEDGWRCMTKADPNPLQFIRNGEEKRSKAKNKPRGLRGNKKRKRKNTGMSDTRQCRILMQLLLSSTHQPTFFPIKLSALLSGFQLNHS